MNYICGCEVPAISPVDEEGFIVCADHGLRRYGWRSLPLLVDEKGKRPYWGAASMTPLEIESHALAGEAITRQ